MYAFTLLKYPHYFLTNDHLGHGKRKPVFGGFANNKGADQLSIHGVGSTPLPLAHWEVSYLTSEFLIFYLVFVAEDTGLSLVLSKNPKHRFSCIAAHFMDTVP